MWIIVLTIYLQHGLTVNTQQVEQRNTQYTTQESCEKRAAALSGPQPIPPGHDAHWQVASCKKV